MLAAKFSYWWDQSSPLNGKWYKETFPQWWELDLSHLRYVVHTMKWLLCHETVDLATAVNSRWIWQEKENLQRSTSVSISHLMCVMFVQWSLHNIVCKIYMRSDRSGSGICLCVNCSQTKYLDNNNSFNTNVTWGLWQSNQMCVQDISSWRGKETDEGLNGGLQSGSWTMWR